jgi:hypothetical protein
MDFIMEYNFKDEHSDFYLKFCVLNLLKIKNPNYYSGLIDLCGYLNFDNAISDLIKGIRKADRNYEYKQDLGKMLDIKNLY